ncbi:hypothetical protein BS78_03G201900 [Paspalum vaginatum]|nr:hypothetical protein BS78_03G201900 [Paspalum vaginatum]
MGTRSAAAAENRWRTRPRLLYLHVASMSSSFFPRSQTFSIPCYNYTHPQKPSCSPICPIEYPRENCFCPKRIVLCPPTIQSNAIYTMIMCVYTNTILKYNF